MAILHVIFLALIFVACRSTTGQLLEDRPCPLFGLAAGAPGVTQDLDLERFANGTWFEVGGFLKGDPTKKCVTHDFVTRNSTTFRRTTALRQMPLIQSLGLRRALGAPHKKTIYVPEILFGYITEKISPGLVRYNFSGQTYMGESEYRVLSTDYDNYAVLWNCEALDSVPKVMIPFSYTQYSSPVTKSFQYLSVNSRQRSMSQNETEALWQTLEKMGIHTSKIESSDQEGCENKDMLTMVPEWSV